MKRLRDIFPVEEDMGVGAIGGGGGDMGTQAIQNFDPVISFKQTADTIKKKKRINKTK
jgi:hypothetical protein